MAEPVVSGATPPAPPVPAFPVARLAPGPRVREVAQEHRFSDWMVARLVRLTDQPSILLDGLRRRPPRYLRVNPLRGGTDEVQKRLGARGFLLSHTDLDPQVFRVRQAPISPGATVEHL